MKITNVLAGQPDITLLGKRAEQAEPGQGEAAKPAVAQAAAGNRSMAAAREILAKYDVKSITPEEFSQMLQKLREAGAISDQELKDLSVVRTELDAAGIEPDESVDLLDFYRTKLAKLQRKTDDTDDPALRQQQISPMLARIDWLERFSAIHAQPDAVGLSTLA